jgi:hypothetical protein
MKKQSIYSIARLETAIEGLKQYVSEKYEFPALVKGKSGSGKTHFVLEFMRENKLPCVFVTTPDHDNYFEHVEKELTRYESALHDQIRDLELSESEKTNDKLKEKLKESECPFVIIDESHKLGIDTEDFQHEKKSYSFGNISVPYTRLIFISHSSLGKNNSENNRLRKILVPTPTRQDICNDLISSGLCTKEQAEWSVKHSSCNFHSAIETSKDWNTPLEKTYNPRGLDYSVIEVLNFYFQTDPEMQSRYKNKVVFDTMGINSIGNCVAKLGLDKKAIEESESILKEEGLIVTGSQSKRIVVQGDKDLKLTLAILKFSGLLKLVEKKKPEPKPETQPAPPKAKVTPPKAKRKTPTSKLDNIKPDKSPSQLYAEISSQIVKPMDPLAKLD